MKKIFITAAVAASLSVSACSTTNSLKTTNEFTAIKTDAKTLMITPDAQLFALLASGMPEPIADWSQAAEENLSKALQAELNNRSSKISFMDKDVDLSEEQVQILKLNDVVMGNLLIYKMLPNKKDTFDLTLGKGANVLAGETAADYALTTTARGSYQTAGKMVVNAAMLVLSAATGVGAYVQMGQQQVQVTLIDLKTGDLVWSNSNLVTGGSDLRKPEGAEVIVKALLKDFPL